MAEPTNDPFNQPSGGGAYPKVEELEGRLVLVRPTLTEKVPDRFWKGKGPAPLKDRITADVIVFNEEGGEHETYTDMYLSQAGLVPSCQSVLRANNPNKPFILGRIGMGPAKETVAKGIATPEALKKALAEWIQRGGKGDKPAYFWGLFPFSEEDANLARPVAMSLLSEANPFA